LGEQLLPDKEIDNPIKQYKDQDDKALIVEEVFHED
jgi:hypothetical protein